MMYKYCRRCGRRLQGVENRMRGYGAVCYQKAKAEAETAPLFPYQLTLFSALDKAQRRTQGAGKHTRTQAGTQWQGKHARRHAGRRQGAGTAHRPRRKDAGRTRRRAQDSPAFNPLKKSTFFLKGYCYIMPLGV